MTDLPANVSTRNIKLTVAYDGTAYHGFQRQATGLLTIQEVLESKLAKIFGHRLVISGAGRTDAGVHAYGQVITFPTTGSIPVEKIPLAALGVLPRDIVVQTAADMPERFHARISAVSKAYMYRIYPGRLPDPLLRKYAWHVAKPLSEAAMQEALSYIVGTHDFSSFQSAGSTIRSPIRTIMEATCKQNGQCLEFSFWGNGFLYHMVRNIVGTVAEVGYGKRIPRDISDILAAKDRRRAGYTAPPQGLYLTKVYY